MAPHRWAVRWVSARTVRVCATTALRVRRGPRGLVRVRPRSLGDCSSPSVVASFGPPLVVLQGEEPRGARVVDELDAVRGGPALPPAFMARPRARPRGDAQGAAGARDVRGRTREHAALI